MLQNSIFDSVMETRDHFKNGANLKSQMSKANNIINIKGSGGKFIRKILFFLVIFITVSNFTFSQSNTSKMKVENITQEEGGGTNGPQVWITVKANNDKTYTLKPPYFKDFEFIKCTAKWVPELVPTTDGIGILVLNFAKETNATLDLRYNNEFYQFVFTIGTEFTIVSDTEGNSPVPVFDGNWTKKQ